MYDGYIEILDGTWDVQNVQKFNLSSKKLFMGVSSCYVRDWAMHHSKVNRM